jgi:hypothetical protein
VFPEIAHETGDRLKGAAEEVGVAWLPVAEAMIRVLRNGVSSGQVQRDAERGVRLRDLPGGERADEIGELSLRSAHELVAHDPARMPEPSSGPTGTCVASPLPSVKTGADHRRKLRVDDSLSTHERERARRSGRRPASAPGQLAASHGARLQANRLGSPARRRPRGSTARRPRRSSGDRARSIRGARAFESGGAAPARCRRSAKIRSRHNA